MTIDIKKSPSAAPLRRAGPAAATTALVIAWACSVDGQGPDPCDPYRISATESVAERVVGPTMVGFADRAGTLAAAAAAWADATESGDGADARDAAAEAWNEAMLIWQRAELMQLGPAGASAYVIGGQNLRDEVYSWPTVSPCRVDEELVARAYEADGFFEDALVNVKGLDAIEYLVFNDGPDNACDASAAINTDGSWGAIASDELDRRRAAYAAAAAAHVATEAERLADAWGPGGEWANWLAHPDEDDAPYPDPAAAADDVMNAILYLDVRVKDRKLAATDAPELESARSGRSKEHVRANLEGLRMVLVGGETADVGYGFDDFLVAVDEPELGPQVIAAVDAAIAAVDAIDGSFEDALAADPDALLPVRSSVQTLTDVLKGPFVAALKLSPPGEGAGDAD